jgi:membrane-bound ClpP family serine protease
LTAPVVWPHTYTLMTLPLLVAGVDLVRGWSSSAGNRLRALGLMYCCVVFLRAEHFAVGDGSIALVGLILATTAPLVLAALLWSPRLDSRASAIDRA